MALTPEDIESRKFRTVRKGYAPDEVKAFLSEVSQALRPHQQLRPGLVHVADEVANVLESAHRTAAEIEANARARAAELVTAEEMKLDSQRAEVQRLRAEVDVELTNARAEAKRARAEIETQIAGDRVAAEKARIEAESFSAAESSRIRQLWAELETDTTSKRARSEADAKALRSEAEEAARILKAEADEHATRVLTEAEATAKRRREKADADADEIRRSAEVQAAKIIADAEAKAANLVDSAQSRAAELEKDGAARAQAHADAVLSESQARLDELLSTERRAHERLRTALAELQVAVDVVGGAEPGSEPAGTAAVRPAVARRRLRDLAEPDVDLTVEPEDRDAITKGLGEAVGDALRPFQRDR